MPIDLPQGDLARTITHEPTNEWPSSIEIVAYWKGRKRNKRRIARISGEEFFGIGTGAPMSGEHLIGIIDRLRRSGNGR